MVLSLFDTCLDVVILSYSKKMHKDVWTLPMWILEAIDKRVEKIQYTKAYKKRFLR